MSKTDKKPLPGPPENIQGGRGVNLKIKQGSLTPKTLTLQFNPKDALLLYLLLQSESKKLSNRIRGEIVKAMDYLVNHLEEISVTPGAKKGSVRVQVTGSPGDEATVKQINHYLRRPYIKELLPYLMDEEKLRITLKRIGDAIREGRGEKLRSGGHLIDNILKSNKPKPKSKQLSIFDTMLQETKDKIISSGSTVELVTRRGPGIKLSKGEYRLLLSLQTLLHKKSQTTDKTAEDYYTGNIKPTDKNGNILKEVELVKWRVKDEFLEVKVPRIGFTLYEITKEYYGGLSMGGEQIRKVAKILYDLAEDPNKKALMRYTRVVDKGEGRTREYFIERYDSLINILTAGYRDFLRGKQIDEKRELVVNLHPITIDQIETKYVDLPLDLTKRMIEAYGSTNVSEITIKLVYELARAHSNRKKLNKTPTGDPIYPIGTNTLYWKIAESYMNPKTGKALRPQLIKEYVNKSIETVKALGLLLSYEILPGESGEPTYYFTLNENWE